MTPPEAPTTHNPPTQATPMLPKATPSNNYHYNKSLKHLARDLRNNSTKAEIYLWMDILKGGFLKGYQFQRQRPILNYIADFTCLELLLVIEVDGMTHEFDEVEKRDIEKQRIMEEVGFTVLRFSDWEVKHRRDEVGEEILGWIEKNEVIK
jgi:very-short-patch-repair endonuclease